MLNVTQWFPDSAVKKAIIPDDSDPGCVTEMMSLLKRRRRLKLSVPGIRAVY